MGQDTKYDRSVEGDDKTITLKLVVKDDVEVTVLLHKQGNQGDQIILVDEAIDKATQLLNNAKTR